TRGCLLRSTPETSRRLRSQIRESPDSPGRFSIPLMIGLAVPAHAGPSGDDAVFLASLERAGITYSHPDQAIASGKAVCALVESGESGLQVVNELRTRNPGFSMDGCCKFAAISAHVYCPHQITKTSVSAK
ncbi:hypothetical protein AO57_03945, partial [Mycobacterium tuberculosis M1956]